MRWGLFLSLALSAAGTARADAGRIAVLDLRARLNVKPEVTAALTDDLISEVRRRSGVKVIGSEEIRSMLRYAKTKQQLGCDAVGCLAEIGGALGAEKIVAGNLSKFGDTYLITLQLIDVRRSVVIRDASQRMAMTNDAELLHLVELAVADLFPDVPPAEAATVPATGVAAPAPVPAAALAPPAAEIVKPNEPAPAKSHVASIVLLSIAGACLLATAAGIYGVVAFDNLRSQSFNQPISMAQANTSNDGALGGFALAWTAGPAAAVTGLIGVLKL